MSARRGFTLVELLVVIGIIALLIAILMPALRIPVFAEGMWVDAWPWMNDPPPHASVVYGPTSYKAAGSSGHMARITMARHGRAINVAFLDGHVERVQLEELWGLQWAPDYVPSLPTSPVP